nr:reverse transcriptase domain-containing protein [Tanacetum cinerariifolium]
MKWKTNVTTKEGIVIKLPGKFRRYKLATEEEVEENEGLKELQNILPWIVTQVTANVSNMNGGDGNGGNNGCSYMTFTAYNPKKFDGKDGAVALTRWIEKMESVFDNYGCITNQRVRFHELAKLVPYLVTLEYSRIKRTPSIQQPEEISWIRFPANVYRSLKIAASLEDKLDIRLIRFEKSLNDMKNSFITSIAPLKAVAETAAVGNFIQNRQQNVSNQMRPSGFNHPTQQNNNQNRFQGNNFNQNQNRQPNQGAIYQNRPQQNLNFQAPSQQNTITQGKFEAYTTANDANMNNL